MMNRAQRRAAHAIQQKTGATLIPDEQLEQFAAMQRYFLAVVKAQGRVRVTFEDVEALNEGDSVRMERAPGGWMLSFVPAAARPEAG